MSSLRGTLSGLIAGVAAVVLVVGFGAVVVGDVIAFREDLLTSIVVATRLAGEHGGRDLATGDRQAAAETLAKLGGVSAVEYVALFDDDDVLVASFGLRDDRAMPRSEAARFAIFADGALHVGEPVFNRGDRLGSIYVRASTRALGQRIWQRILILVLLLAALLGAAVALAMRAQRMITRPILDLAGAARRISETGNHSIRVDEAGDDEIRALGESFNRMMDQIQLRQLEHDEAMHRTREKSQFLAAMSHELRTPLNSIIGFSEILIKRLEGSIEPKMASFLVNVNSSGRHLLGIINDILDLSKVEAGKMALHPEPVSLAAILEGVVAVMRGTSQKRGVEIVVEGVDKLPVIEADPVQLKQVFFNLIANAVKFSPKNSEVRIVARWLAARDSALTEEVVEIDFIDRGIGIAAEDFEKIFQPFRQADSGITRRFGGTGLGLSLVRSYLTQHRGVVRVASKVGEGSTFTVVLPVSGSSVGRRDQTGSGRPREAPSSPSWR